MAWLKILSIEGVETAQKKAFRQFLNPVRSVPPLGMRDAVDNQQTYAQFVGRAHSMPSKLIRPLSFATWVNQSSKWFGLHRDSEDQASVCCVSVARCGHGHTASLTVLSTFDRYGPRQSKSTAYNEKGKLNIEVKFAPFSCTRRRSPLHVSAFAPSDDFHQTE